MAPLQAEAEPLLGAGAGGSGSGSSGSGSSGSGGASGKSGGGSGGAAAFRASALSRLLPEDSAYGGGHLLASLHAPGWGITPGQDFVMYRGDVCLGSATVALPGRSLLEEGVLP